MKNVLYFSALEGYLGLYNKVNKCAFIKYKILLKASMFCNMLAVNIMLLNVYYTCGFVRYNAKS
jgi:hypothetical protein